MGDKGPLKALMLWVEEATGETNVTLADLVDGSIVFDLVTKIAPSYAADDGTSLEDACDAIESYATDALGWVDVLSNINSDLLSAGRAEPMEALLSLILAAAVHCEEKESFISDITSLSSEVQTSLMLQINLVLEQVQPSDMDGPSTPRSPSKSNASASSIPGLGVGTASSSGVGGGGGADGDDPVVVELKSLRMENASLIEEKESLLTDLEELQKQLEAKGTGGDGSGMESSLREHMQRLESILEEKDSELEAVMSRAEESRAASEEELQELADQLDVAKSQVAQMYKLEAQLERVQEKYHDKTCEVDTLKERIKILEEQNSEYLTKVMGFEDRKGAHQLAQYKTKVVELEAAVLEAKKRATIAQEEGKVHRVELKEVQSELKRQQELLRAAQRDSQRATEAQREAELAHGETRGELEADLASARLDVTKLQRENAALKSAAASGVATTADDEGEDPQVTMLKSQLEDAHNVTKTMMQKHTEEVTRLRKEVEELKAMKASATEETTLSSEAQRELEDAASKAKSEATEAKATATKLEREIASLSDQLKEATDKVSSIEKEKDEAIAKGKADVERAKEYILRFKRAQSSIQSKNDRDARKKDLEKVDELQRKLDREVENHEALKHTMSKERDMFERERMLMASVVFNHGQMRQKALLRSKARSSASTAPSTFLRAQRDKIMPGRS